MVDLWFWQSFETFAYFVGLRVRCGGSYEGTKERRKKEDGAVSLSAVGGTIPTTTPKEKVLTTRTKTYSTL